MLLASYIASIPRALPSRRSLTPSGTASGARSFSPMDWHFTLAEVLAVGVALPLVFTLVVYSVVYVIGWVIDRLAKQPFSAKPPRG